MMYGKEAPFAERLQTHDDYYLKTSEDGTWDLSWPQSSEPKGYDRLLLCSWDHAW